MKRRLIKVFASLVLVVLAVLTVMPNFSPARAAEGDTYELVTDASTLKAGDTIIIVAKEFDYALSTDQKNNNRGQAEVTKSGSNKETISNPSADVQIITLEKDTTTGTFAFNVGTEKYLYCASTSSNNYLKTKETKDETGSWSITITPAGVATIKAQTSSSIKRNLLSYNSSSSCFACYSSVQKDVSIYKLVESGCEHTNKVSIGEEKAASCTEDGITAGEKCADCGTVTTPQDVLPATGHNYVDGVCTKCGANLPKYIEVELADIKSTDVIIIVATTSDGTSYAMSKDNGKDAAPTAVSVSITDDTISTDAKNILWNIDYDNDNGNITIYPNGKTETWLYCTSTNNGVRVGTNANKIFTLDSTSGYLKHTATSRYLGVFTTNPDWRCYTSSTVTNIKDQTFSFYKLDDGSSESTPEVEPSVKSVSLSLNKGVTVKVKYNIPELWLTENPGAKLVFSNGQEFEARAGENVYSVNLMPCGINDALTAKIRLSDGTDYGTEVDVSVNAYKAKIVAAGYEALGISEAKYNALIALLDAALTYSDAADKKTFAEEPTADFGSVTDTSITHGSVKVFGGYAGTLGEYATVKIVVETANVTDQTVTVKVGDNVVISGGKLADYVTAEGYIVIDSLYPTHFNDTITIETSDGTKAVFTFNSYLKSIYTTTADTELKTLAAATYLYGAAAEAYSTAE